MKSTPPPPYSAGALAPRKPASPILRQLSRSLMPARFQPSIFGTSSFSTKRRTWVRNISCSSLKISRRIFDLLEIRPNPCTSAPINPIPAKSRHIPKVALPCPDSNGPRSDGICFRTRNFTTNNPITTSHAGYTLRAGTTEVQSMKAIQFDRLGGPEVMYLADVPKPELRPGTIIVKNEIITINFGDIFFTRGEYLVKPVFPDTPGMEG